jgi:signal transduction histidine kinase
MYRKLFLIFTLVLLNLAKLDAQHQGSKSVIHNDCNALVKQMKDSLDAFKLSAAVKLADSLLVVATGAKLPCYCIDAYLIKANANIKRQQSEMANQCFNNAFQLLKGCNQNKQTSHYYSTLALLNSVQTQHNEAINNSKHALSYLDVRTDYEPYGKLLYKIAKSQFNLDDYEAAINNILQALNIAQAYNDSSTGFELYQLLGHCYAGLGFHDKALNCFLQASDFDKPNVSKIQRRTLYYNIAFAALVCDSLQLTQRYDGLFEEINKQFSDDYGKGLEAKLKGILLFKKSMFLEALPYLKKSFESIEISKKHFQTRNPFDNECIIYAKCLAECNQPDTSIVLLNNFLRKIEVENIQTIQPQIYFSLVLAYNKKQQQDSVYYYLNKLYDSKDSVFKTTLAESIAKNEVNFNTQFKDREIERLNLTNQINQLRLRLHGKALSDQQLENKNQQTLLNIANQQKQIDRRILIQQQDSIRIKNHALTIQKQQEKLTQVALVQSRNKYWILVLFTSALAVTISITYWRYKKNKLLNYKLDASITQLKAAQKKLIQLEREKAEETVKTDLARDLHDDLGASLSSISVQSIAAKNRLLYNQTDQLPEILDTISNDAQEMVAHINDRVWLMKPNLKTVESLLDHLQSFAITLFMPKQILFKLTSSGNSKAIVLGVENQKNIYLIFKEAINNVAKYSDATIVHFNAKVTNTEVQFTLTDNGKGFELNQVLF